MVEGMLNLFGPKNNILYAQVIVSNMHSAHCTAGILHYTESIDLYACAKN